MHTHALNATFSALWFWTNLLTGISYVVIARIIWGGWRVQPRFGGLFTGFILACGVHHVVHALAVLVNGHSAAIMPAQAVVDVAMTSVSVVTMILIIQDWRSSYA